MVSVIGRTHASLRSDMSAFCRAGILPAGCGPVTPRNNDVQNRVNDSKHGVQYVERYSVPLAGWVDECRARVLNTLGK